MILYNLTEERGLIFMVRIPYHYGEMDIGREQLVPDHRREVVDNALPFLWMPVGIWMGLDFQWWWVAAISGIIWLYYARKLVSALRMLHWQRRANELLRQ